MTVRPVVEDVLPLTPLQQGMLFHALDGATPDVYTVRTVLHLRDRVDPDRLRAAAEQLVQRHAPLRSAFRPRADGEFVQVVRRSVPLPWRVADELPPAPAFDVGRAPLFAFTLVRDTLVIDAHHLLWDGWSAPILARELFTLYAGRPLPAVHPVRDHLAWLSRRDAAAAKQAWAHHLSDLDGPTLVARGAAPGRPQRREFRVPSVAGAARAHGLTASSVLQAAWALLLAELTGRTDLVFGTTVSGRHPDVPGVETMVGMLINTVPSRIRLHPAETPIELATRIQADQATLLDHQHLGLAEIQQAAGRGTLFDTLLVVETYPGTDLTDSPLAAVEVHDATHYPLTLLAVPTPGDLLLRLDHNPTAIPPDAAAHLAHRLSELLSYFRTSGEISVANLPLGGATGLSEATGLGGATGPGEAVGLGDAMTGRGDATGLGDAAGLGDAVGPGHATGLGDAAALGEAVGPGDAAALGEAVGLGDAASGRGDATGLGDAAGLGGAVGPGRAAGLGGAVGPGGGAAGWGGVTSGVVGVVRSVPEVGLAGLFAEQVRRSPAATAVVFEGERVSYAELDARVEALAVELVRDGAGPGRIVGVRLERSVELVVALLATHRAGAAYLPLDPSYPAARLELMVEDARPVLVLGGAAVGGEPALVSREAAYVIFTSGSTGRPKGVVVPHRAIVNRLLWMQDEYGLGGGDRVLQKTPSSFDVSVWEFFWPLITGATVVVAKPGGHRDPRYLAELIERESIGTVHFVPSMLRAYLEAGGRPEVIERIICSGEALPVDLALPNVHNLYGPTEAAVDVTFWPPDGSVPIGRPVWNTQLYVLDPFLRPAGVGELYLGGAQLAEGYLHRPGLTASRFVANPFEPGKRLYRTGDLVRRDGEVLHYLGRLDDQVKLRGFRVELGEVEAALRAQPGVRAAAAAVNTEREQLVGYVVGDPGGLRERLAATLPDQLVPSVIVELDELPLTPSGKLDRRALPAPPERSGESAGSVRDPREEVLAGLFADVLGREGVGRHDDFFALGGHSLLATRLVSRVRRAFGADLGIRAVFDAPTVARLAVLLDGARNNRPAIGPSGQDGPVPLSAAQRSLWFLYQLEGPDPTYNIVFVAQLKGTLDRDALHAALGDVIVRHEPLRTLLSDAGQRILPQPRVRFGVDVATHGFRLDEEPPLLAELRATGPDEHLFTLVVHHVAADEWSARPLLRDLATAYAARREGRAPQWSPLPVRYADYARWQRRDLSAEREFWLRTLEELPEELPLPRDRPRGRSRRGGEVVAGYPQALPERMGALARRLGVTELMIAQAATAVLLAGLGAGEDVPLGTPVAGRGDQALDELVGLFVNPLVLRTDLSGDPTFTELLGRVRAAALAAYDHQELPFDQVVEALQPPRAPGRHPLFQVMVSQLDEGATGWELAGLAVQTVPAPPAGAKFDLAFHFGTGEVRVTYAAEQFDESTVDAMARRLVRLLDGLTAAPGTRIGGVELVDEAERAALDAFNDTAEQRPVTTLTAMVEEQVARTPDAVAVEFHERSLTYAELDARANALAHRLVAAGVGPERTVGMHWERSVELVVGLLAVLKAGGAFVPLEPSWPDRRIAEVAANARFAAVLSGPGHDAPMRGLGIPVLHVQEQRSPAGPRRTTEPEGLAYVIYTSGSTGTPKGAMIRHRAIAHRLLWQRELLGFGPGDASLFKAPLGFDISINEIFLPLVTGGKLVVAEPGGERDIDYLLGLIERHAVTFTYLPSSILDLLVGLERFGERARSLRHVWCGGEVLTPGLFARFRALSSAIMYHGYGPAEATIGVSHVVYREPSAMRNAVSIGHPNGNTRLYVLDRHLRRVPVGVPGELYAGGVYLGRGYLNDPARTAAHFVADPHTPGERLYRTGDLARWQPDGTLEFLGRADNQIKIRGMRVELEEIEAVLEQHDAVRRAVVLVRDGRLIAYCVGAPAELADWLRGRLPGHMVPLRYVFLDGFPLLASGKVNRKALPEPEPEPVAAGREPRTGAEQRLCELMAEVLRLPRVGPEDNFFSLGGDSILSIRLVGRARAAGLPLSARQVFEAQTPATLARLAPEVRVPAGDRSQGLGEVPLTPVMRWWRERGDPGMAQAALLRVPPAGDPARFADAVRAVVERHDMLRARLTGDRLVVAAPGRLDAGLFARVAAGADVAVAYREKVAELDPAAGVLVRAVWFDAGPEEDGRLLLVIHHLAVDGVSWRIIAGDLERAFAKEELDPVPTSFRWFASNLPSPSREEIAWWRENVPETEADTTIDRTSGTRRVEIPADALLREVPTALRATAQEVLLAALAEALGERTIALEGHGREEHLLGDADLSRTVGWFTTVYPFPLKGTLRDLKHHLRSVPHQGFNHARTGHRADPAVGFNYLGRFDLSTADGYWIPAGERLPEPGLQHRPLEINVVTEDRPGGPVLVATWSWTAEHDAAGIDRLIAAWRSALDALVAAARGGAVPGLTPADVPLVNLKQSQLDSIAAKWRKK